MKIQSTKNILVSILAIFLLLATFFVLLIGMNVSAGRAIFGSIACCFVVIFTFNQSAKKY
mgnify:FL=1